MTWKPYILISFAFWNSRRGKNYARERRHEMQGLIVDSGAFTAYTAGDTVGMDDYLAYLDALSDIIDHYVQLDVVGNAERTRANFDEMRERGYHPMAVHQYGAPVEDYFYFAEHAEFVCSGGLAGNPKNFAYMEWLWPLVKDADCKTHLLGFGIDRANKAMRPDQIDSSNWNRGGRYKMLEWFNGSSISAYTTPQLREGRVPRKVVTQQIHSNGFTIHDALFTPAFYDRMSARSYLRYACYLEREHGIRYYLAVMNPSRLRVLLDECRSLNEAGILEPR